MPLLDMTAIVIGGMLVTLAAWEWLVRKVRR